MISVADLVKISPYCKRYAEQFVGPLNEAMDEFYINDSKARESAFLAQIMHESGSLRYVKEIASGVAYEGRKDLGNVFAGDGIKYKGRGLIQITGRDNYRLCGEALSLPLLDHPELLETPVNACRSAAWFWHDRGLNVLADMGEFDKITRRINGGTNGKAERDSFFALAKATLGSDPGSNLA